MDAKSPFSWHGVLRRTDRYISHILKFLNLAYYDFVSVDKPTIASFELSTMMCSQTLETGNGFEGGLASNEPERPFVCTVTGGTTMVV